MIHTVMGKGFAMPLAEVVTVEVGATIAKYILKLWLKDTSLGNDIASTAIDILKSKTSDMLAQRRGNRQFEIIGEKVGENLLPLFEHEGAHLDEGERIAVAYAVAGTFNQSILSTELVVKRNLQPAELSCHIFAAYPRATRDFSEAASELYRRIINEACTYIVDIASQLPSFTERTFAEVLKREDDILKRVDQVLSELQKIREQLDPMIEAESFEIEYRQAIARNLDILQLIGADVSLPNRRHKLSVAYITLSVEQQPSTVMEADGNSAEEETAQEIVSVNVALARSHRLLIRGVAGSGKTTLLQWIAVRAATKTFEGELADWNTYLPFFLRLRHYVQARLPRPEAFPEVAASLIVGTMPSGWVHTALKSGRALVLVDGIDEVPASQREEVHTWLNDLVATYPRVRFIVTSRPHAIPEGWMNHQAFEAVELQPMELPDIAVFIDHWHRAVRDELQTDEEKRELDPLANHLKAQVRLNRAIRTLATSPLLCAMLCAIHRDRRRHLPVNRVELYRACCSLLLERRDKESRIDLADYPALTLGQKERILQGLAYWMLQANLSETDVLQVDERFSEQLAHMPNLSQDITGTAVRRLLVERAGIIREPIAGQIDFTHRTFEEFFAAQAALDARDIGRLVAGAHDDQWREVIILAAGLASKALCEQLITGLIKRGDAEKVHRHQLHLLAVSCLETAIELALEVKNEVEKRLHTLVPPKNLTSARALASAGDLAVPYLQLSRLSYINTQVAVPCIQSLALIGTELALEQLEEYASCKYFFYSVADALYQAWNAFDKEAYA